MAHGFDEAGGDWNCSCGASADEEATFGGDDAASDAGIGMGVSVSMSISDELSKPASAVNADKTALLFEGAVVGAFVLLIALVLLSKRAIMATFCDSEQSVRLRIDWILFLISGMRSSTCRSVDVVTGIGARCTSLPPGTAVPFSSIDAPAFDRFACPRVPPHAAVVAAVVACGRAASVVDAVGEVDEGGIALTALTSFVRLAACERRGIEAFTDASKPEPAPNMTSPLAESGDPSRPTDATAAAACTATTAASLLRLMTSSGPSTAVGKSETISVCDLCGGGTTTGIAFTVAAEDAVAFIDNVVFSLLAVVATGAETVASGGD